MSIRKFAPPGYQAMPALPSDRRFMQLNCHVALWSKHLAHKISAAIVDDAGRVLSLGFNGHAHGIEDGDPLHWGKPDRYAHSVHAEDNALLNARLTGVSVRGATMHVIRFPCAGDTCVSREGCSQQIVGAGIGTLVVYSHPDDATHPRHTDSFRRSLDYLIDHGIAIRWHDPEDEAFHGHMTRRADTLPVPSGSTDWPARFLDLACYLSRWQPDGIGEVIVRRPLHGDEPASGDPGLRDRMGKIVRSLGCRQGHAGGRGALESARQTGLSTAGCTLFMSRPPEDARLVDAAGSGIGTIVLPATALHGAWLDDHRSLAQTSNLELSLMEPALQPAPAGSSLYPERRHDGHVLTR